MAVADGRVKISARNWANLQGKISSLVNHLISLTASDFLRGIAHSWLIVGRALCSRFEGSGNTPSSFLFPAITWNTALSVGII